MSEFVLELARPADDPAIRQLLRTIPMPGNLAIGYEREPDYFLGCGVLSPFYQVVVARYRLSGEVVGVAVRAVRQLYVNGQAQPVGYLSQLRIDPRFRGRWLVSQGFRIMAELHADGRTVAYLSSIIEGNGEAMGILVDRPRKHFPAFREVGRLTTLALLLRRGRPPRSDTAVVGATREDLAAIAAFLAEHGPQRQFFPVLTLQDLEEGSLLPGLDPTDWLIARRDGAIRGVLALWDQSAFKQNVIRGYHGPWRLGRPLYNLWAHLSRSQPLPPVGSALRQLYGAFFCVAEDDPATGSALLAGAAHAAAARGFAHLLLGLSDQDPLLALALRHRHVAYQSRLYTATWRDGGEFHERLDARIPYVEIASL